MSNSRAACARKFVLYLHDNGHLDDFKVAKIRARELYNSEFKKKYRAKFSFSTIFFQTLYLLVRQENLNLMVFKKNKITNLKHQEPQIDQALGKGFFEKATNEVTASGDNIPAVSVPGHKRKMLGGQLKTEETYKQYVKNSSHSFIDDFNKALKRNDKHSDLEFTVEGVSSLTNIIVRKEEQKTLNFQIKNITKLPITIVHIEYIADIKKVEFTPTCPFEIPPLGSVNYILTVYSTDDGIIYYPVVFTAGSNNNTQNYAVEMVFHVHDDFFDDLHPVEPYVRTSKVVLREFIEHVDSGERPNMYAVASIFRVSISKCFRFPKLTMKVPLKQYLLPLDIAVLLNAGLKSFDGMTRSQHAQLATINNTLRVKDKQNCLHPENYTKLLDLLLFIEEHQMYKDIRGYDREDQVLQKVPGEMLELEVPGLAEHRPSVILSDSVFIREHKNSTTLFEGFVHRIKETSVVLKFSKKFMNSVFVKDKKFYVNFTFNRYPLKVEHQALEFTRTDNIVHLLFPKKIERKTPYSSNLVWFNRDIANNLEQQQAVRSILNRTAMPAPYLIFGPPGTGKTMTIVESVRQIHRLTYYKILICTPSNNAANEITKRLKGIPTTDMFRFIAPSFPTSMIPDEIKKYTNFSNGNYYQPTIEEFMKYKILITTLCSAAKLVNSGCPQNHFGYVFIDESGQATETETLIPIAHILSSGTKPGVISGQIVLAGDPMQLGPVIHSPLAKDYGFGTSMLERLMSTSEPYKKDTSKKYNSSALTKLVKNYRSHSVILKVPNNLFYEDELETAGDNMINVALNWEHLPNRQFPMIFHSVVGIDQREKNSPSFFNVLEIRVVMQYLEKLIGCKMQGISIKEDHIGIISPYKKQVEKIKQACKNKRYSGKLMIGSVEQLQGQERLIIIISTVRSHSDFLVFDSKYHLGFLMNPKRFNVAVTRAKALLIVIGNPHILQYDKNWFNLITYCKENNSIIGDKFEMKKDENIEKLVNDTQAVSLDAQPNPEDGPSFIRGNL